MLELLTVLWVPKQEAREQWHRASAGHGAGIRRENLVTRGFLATLASNLWAGADEMGALLTSRLLGPLRVALFFTLMVLVLVFLMRPRRHIDFDEFMEWMGGQRWERSELGVAAARLDVRPLATRRSEKWDHWRILRAVRSEGDLCNAAVLTNLLRTPRLRVCRSI